jgi:hypothetical protein
MKLLPVAAAVLAAALTLATAARADGPIPAPPISSPSNGGQAAGSIFDAMLAIARAAADNAAGAQNASSAYTQAIQQFNAGQYTQARQSALQAIAQTGAAPLPRPSLYPLYIPQPAYPRMPLVVNADEADAEGTVALARQELLQCGAASPPPTVVQQYTAAVDNLLGKQYLTARGEAEILINYCAAATQLVAQQAAAHSPPPSTPIPMTAYSPVPVATLIPDPALAQKPVAMPTPAPTAEPAYKHHLFGL